MRDPPGQEDRRRRLGQVGRIEAGAGEEIPRVVQRHDDDDDAPQQIDRVQSNPAARPWLCRHDRSGGAASDGGLHTPPG
jgi:hypothetical protein